MQKNQGFSATEKFGEKKENPLFAANPKVLQNAHQIAAGLWWTAYFGDVSHLKKYFISGLAEEYLALAIDRAEAFMKIYPA